MSTRTVTLDRTYSASPQQIWKAWTDPEILSRWHGCAADQLWTVHEWNVEVGGTLQVSMEMDGTPFVVDGEFLAVDEPRLLRYTFGSDATITVTIDPLATATRVTVVHDGLPDRETGAIVTDGWTNSLAQLGDAL